MLLVFSACHIWKLFTANYIHCSAKLSVNFHNSQFTTVPSLSVSADDVPTCGRCADDVQMTYVIHQPKSPMKSHSRVIRTSSAHHPHVICTSSTCHTHKTSVPRLFQVKQQRTALLKMKVPQKLMPLNYPFRVITWTMVSQPTNFLLQIYPLFLL